MNIINLCKKLEELEEQLHEDFMNYELNFDDFKNQFEFGKIAGRLDTIREIQKLIYKGEKNDN